MFKYIAICVLLFTSNISACQDDIWYSKVEMIGITAQAGVVQHDFTKVAYAVEVGIDVNTDYDVIPSSSRIGVSYFNHIGMRGKDEWRYSAETVEIFGEQSWWYKDYYITVGAGYKTHQDPYINKAGTQYRTERIIHSEKDRVTARFAVGKRTDNWEVALVHKSNWFVGMPVNDKWEYHFTGISVGYVFDLGRL